MILSYPTKRIAILFVIIYIDIVYEYVALYIVEKTDDADCFLSCFNYFNCNICCSICLHLLSSLDWALHVVLWMLWTERVVHSPLFSICVGYREFLLKVSNFNNSYVCEI